MTTATEARPLEVGDRVSYKGSAGTVVPVLPHHSDMDHSHVLIRFDDRDREAHTQRDFYPWAPEASAPLEVGSLYYYVQRNDSHLERLPYVPKVGDVVDATGTRPSTPTRRGTVYSVQHHSSATDSSVEFVWVGGTGEEWSDDDPFRTWIAGTEGGIRTVMPTDDVPEGTRGRWFTLARDTVTLAPSSTSEAELGAAYMHSGPGALPSPSEVGAALSAREEAPSEATQPPADSAEVSALRQQVETLERRLERARRDVVTIAEALKETADRNEWCGEYERQVEELHGNLTTETDDLFCDAASRAVEYRVTFTYSTTVRASSAYEACERAQDEGFNSWDGEWDAEEE